MAALTRCGVVATLDSGNTWKTLHTSHRENLGDILFDHTGHLVVFYPELRLEFDENFLPVRSESHNGSHLKSTATPRPNEYFAASYSQDGVLMSLDGGVSWKSISFQSNPRIYHTNSLALARNGDIFIGSGSGVFFSSNKGGSWHPRIAPGEGHRVVDLALDSVGNLFAATDHAGIWRMMYGDTTWEAVNNGIEATSMNINVPGMNFEYIVCKDIITTSNALYAAVGSGVYYSTNNGDSWSKIDQGLPYVEKNSVRFSKVSTLTAIHPDRVVTGTSGYGLFILDSPR